MVMPSPLARILMDKTKDVEFSLSVTAQKKGGRIFKDARISQFLWKMPPIFGLQT